ncbi:DMT family transporter [Candidatus Bipolaricaulota bacterium]|jgi:transporter family protein|nr:DMT family transporter [Candidatus Bipolaricaulota bacterium]
MAFVFAIAAAAAWGVAMTVAKPGAHHLDPITFLRFRWIVALLIALLYGLLTNDLALPSGTAAGLVMLGSLLNAVIGWTLYLIAMQHAPAYQITALASTAPLWGVLGAVVIVGEPFRWTAFVAALLVVAGAILLVDGDRRQRSSLIGVVLAIAAGILWGVSETVPMKLATEMGITPATSIVLFAMAAIAGNTLAIPLLRKRVPKRVSRRGLAFAAISAISGAFLGWLFWLNGLRLAPASLLAPVRGSTLVFTFLFSVLFLRERPSKRAIGGVALVFGGVLLVSLGTIV